MDAERLSTGFVPHRFQREIVKKLKKRNVIIFHRRGGKTVLSLNLLVHAALTSTKRLPRFAYVAPYLNQARDISWDYLRQYTEKVPGRKVNESVGTIRFAHNNSLIKIYGADKPHALRGSYLDGVVVDEVADMKSEVWGEVILPMLMDRDGWVLFIGTPRGQNLLYELYTAALDDPEWYADSFDLYRTHREIPWLDLLEIEDLRTAPGTSDNQWRQEWLVDFTASCDDTLIPIDDVSRAAGHHLPKSAYKHAPRIMGVDVARFGGDSSVLFLRQGLVAFKPVEIQGADTDQVVGHVAAKIHEWKPHAVCIDEGYNPGVIDNLRHLGHAITGVQFGARALDQDRYKNRRSEMWGEMAVWFRENHVAIPNNPRLVQELVIPTYGYTPSGQIMLEPKDKIKERLRRSPDLADALALTFAQHVAAPGLDDFFEDAVPMTKCDYNVLEYA